MADKTKEAKKPEPKEAPQAPGFGKVNPKVAKALGKTPTGLLTKILGKAQPRKGSSK